MNPETLTRSAALTETPVVVCQIPGFVQSYAAFNAGAAGAYLHFMDAATSAAAVAGAIVATVFVPAGGGANLACLQWRFLNGIYIAASSSATALSAPTNSIVVNVGRG